MIKYLLVIGFISCAFFAKGQGTYMQLGSDGEYYVERLNIKYSKIIPIEHTGDKPYPRGRAAHLAETLLLSNLRFNKVQRYQLQYLIDENGDWLDSLRSKTRRPAWKFWREPASFLHYTTRKKDMFDLRFNPMIEVHLGAESQNSRFIFTRALGLEVRGNIKRVFSFYFNVTGNSARLPKFIEDKANDIKYTRAEGHSAGQNTNDYLYVPGTAYWKDYSSKIFKFSDGVDYFDARGYINVHVLKHINLTFGRDKNFIGNGQRSLFLSDYAAPYLFLKFNVNLWRFNYQSIFAELTSQYIRGGDKLLPKKYMAVHHLSVQATHWLNFGLFEAVVMNRSGHFELQYLNPIIFYRAVEHALGSPDNELVGADFKINAFNHLSIYGQFLLDEFNVKHITKRDGWWANKWGLQFGLKYIDIFPNLDGQLELNVVRPFTYTHESGINYTHYNQPLAHPLGASFYEVILNLHYEPLPKLAFNLRYSFAKVGDDSLDVNGNITNFGSDILRSSGGGASVTQELNNKIAQGAKGTINYFQVRTSYMIWHNIYVVADILYRSKSSSKPQNPNSALILQNQSTFLFMIGARMNIPYKTYQF